ncbi:MULTISPECIES: DUF4097 family beta strand repeat-containing protein [unclassified Luteococcus]|uniref:DUF4097 family beta strand repeat-containing protein n=1 Tax=unclassified Luteococcus TaxID=2639923 RepID=UPI00313B84CD
MNSDQTTRTFTFDVAQLAGLTVIAPEADLEIDHNADPGQVRIEVTASEPSYLDEALKAEEKDGRIELVIPPVLTTGKGAGFALQIGRTSVRFGHTAGVSASVSIPPGTALDLDGKTGDVTINGEGGRLRARTTSGDLTLESCSGGEITAGSGVVSLDEAPGETRIKTGSGEIRVETASGDLELASGSGDVELGCLGSGRVTARTGSGDITIGAKRGIPVWQDASTGTGDLDVQLSPRGEPTEGQPHLEIRASSGSGDVTLTDA